MPHHVVSFGAGTRQSRRLSARVSLTVSVAALAFAQILFSSAASYGSTRCHVPAMTDDVLRLEVEELTGLREYIGVPRLVRFDVVVPDPGRNGQLETVGVMHGLFLIPIEQLARTIRDVERLHEFVPRLEGSEIICTGSELPGYSRVLYELSFRFLVFRQDYRFIADYFVMDDLDATGEYRVWWRLSEPLDGEIVDAAGSWYLKRVQFDAKEYTYAAYAVNTAFRERSIGLSTALSTFGERDARQAMAAFVAEAERRGR
jgi:hypothetical protein